MPNHVSTWSTQDAEMGVKSKATRGLASSQARTAGVLWVDTLSSTTCPRLVRDPPRAHLERGEHAGRAVAGVVVRVALHLPGPHPQH